MLSSPLLLSSSLSVFRLFTHHTFTFPQIWTIGSTTVPQKLNETVAERKLNRVHFGGAKTGPVSEYILSPYILSGPGKLDRAVPFLTRPIIV